MSFYVETPKYVNIDVYKIIQIIQDDFTIISYKTIQQDLKLIPQNELMKYIVNYIKKVENVKEQTILKITKLFEANKKQKNEFNRNEHFCYFSPGHNINTINYLNLQNLSSSPNINHSLFSPERSNSSNSYSNSKSEKKIKINNNINEHTNNILQTEIDSHKHKYIKSQVSLAKEIISFIDDMKSLQMSIMKKDINITNMKKAFEKKKISLYKDAQQYIKISSTSSTQMNTNKTNISNNNDNSTLFSNSSTSSTHNIKEFNDTISSLRTAIEDIKTNNKFITEQLRSEISTLSSKNEESIVVIKEYENLLIKNISSIKSIYKSLKEITPQYKSDSLSMQINTITSNNNISSFESKFQWYEQELNKIISLLQANNSVNKICEIIKLKANEIIQIIQPFLENNSETEFDINFQNGPSSPNSYLYEETIVLTAIENLKKYITSLSEFVLALKEKNDKLQQQINDTKLKTNTYKALLLQTTINKSPNNNTPTSLDNVNQMNMNLIKIQIELINKIEELEIENEKHREHINNILQNENVINNETVPKDKYSYLLNLYSDEQEKSKIYHNKYISLIQELGSYIKTKEKINVNETYSNNGSNCNFINEQIDSSELGRINENDLINSRGSNCNRYEQEIISINRKKYDNMVNEIKVIKTQNEKMRKKISNYSGIVNTIANIIEKLLNEITLNIQLKEYFILIFRILNYSEDKINLIISSKK